MNLIVQLLGNDKYPAFPELKTFVKPEENTTECMRYRLLL